MNEAVQDLSLLSIADVASILQRSIRSVTTLIKEGRIKSFRVGRHRRFTREAVEEYLASLQRPEASPA